jgi:hypothetical protein
MENCCFIWGGAPKSSLSALDRIQNKAAKLLGPSEAVKLQYLSHRRGVSSLCAMHRIVHRSAPAPLHVFCPPRAHSRVRRSSRTQPHGQFFQPPRINSVTPSYWIRSFIPLMTHAWNEILLPHHQTETNLQKFKLDINSSLDLTFL